ncbi:unnamed protein product [Adineta steineri]|uniref:SAC3/GANP/THP3 conserved domain-containing protein n=1 Tax=Adineta steineri TaxID=433720 RepID=A0A818M9K9_9BILA|nr:unnamed protein product [Adineta steineri]
MRSSLISQDSKSEETKRLEQRRNRFTNESTATINRPIKSINEPNQPLIGTCEKLEKNYLRLTSAPDPSTIRPLAILEKSFSFVIDKYKSNNDWSYVNSQLKSIRQDLMVQTIRNDFTVLVYEENARIALEMNDREQFIQCQTQLEILYDSGCNNTHLQEFLMYRLLYLLLLNDYKKVNRILIDIDQVTKSDDLNITLEFCSAFRRKNYNQLFILYKHLPRLACCLVNLFIDIYRKQIIEILIWAFLPTFPIEIVTTMLVYESNEICQEHLHSLGVKFLDNTMLIDYPLELVLNSTDSQGIFYCNSRVELTKQKNKLTASINHLGANPPTFQFKTEPFNSTTIRIVITPNGYIGTSRISCHWDNNITYGQTVDLIIGEKPGIIQLKEPCKAYDYRYIQCIFNSPIIARAFRNGFPRLYKFSELNNDEFSYRHPPKYVNNTNNKTYNNELIFHFEPRDQNTIPKKTLMNVNMSISRFGSSVYQFSIEPVHTTLVDFELKDISCKKLTIQIKHNNTRALNERLCSGHIRRIDDQKKISAIRDIVETSDQTILIDRLQLSTKYTICLRCYYKQTDESFKEKTCVTVSTDACNRWVYVVVIAVGVLVLVISSIVFVLKYYRGYKLCPAPSIQGSQRDRRESDTVSIHTIQHSEDDQQDYRSEYSPLDSEYQPDDNKYLPVAGEYLPEEKTYLPVGSKYSVLFQDEHGSAENNEDESKVGPMTNTLNISPDTRDLTNSNSKS